MPTGRYGQTGSPTSFAGSPAGVSGLVVVGVAPAPGTLSVLTDGFPLRLSLSLEVGVREWHYRFRGVAFEPRTALYDDEADREMDSGDLGNCPGSQCRSRATTDW